MYMYVMIHVLQLGHHTMVFLYNSYSSQIQKTATSHSSPGNNYAGWIDVFISIGAYEYYDIIIEASAMAQYSQDINSLANDGYALHAV